MQRKGVWGDIPIRLFLENQELADGPYVFQEGWNQYMWSEINSDACNDDDEKAIGLIKYEPMPMTSFQWPHHANASGYILAISSLTSCTISRLGYDLIVYRGRGYQIVNF